MWGYEYEDFGDILSAGDFSQAAIDVFKILQFTESNTPVNTAENALSFAYSSLPSDLVLSQEERQILSSLSQMAHLFDIADFEAEVPFVRFFSVDLNVEKSNRSQTQYNIHSIIARKSFYCAIVLFRNDTAISISMSYHKASAIGSVFLSDWYTLYSVELDNFFEAIGSESFSIRSGFDYTSDLIYLTARGYYKYPQSYEYTRYEQNTDESILDQIADQYNFDFITDAFIEMNNSTVDTIEEIDFDLIEYELEQMSLAELEESDEDEFDEEYTQSLLQNSKLNSVEEIPKEILADPVLLLKWLDAQSPENALESETLDMAIKDLINAENIDYVDHRNKGGRLWIFGGYELSGFVVRCKEIGVEFHYKEGGGKATDNFDAWWCR